MARASFVSAGSIALWDWPTEHSALAIRIMRHLGSAAAGDLVTAGADGAIVTSDLGDWSAAFRSNLQRRDHAPAELDERTVAFEQSDGRWQVVVAEPAVWEERACKIAGRVLTQQEWAELLGSRSYAPACGE